jgi:hypothetical protein
MKKNVTLLLLVLICFITLFLNSNSFNGYFFQDDWFSFQISHIRTISQFLSFFIPRTDVIYYRPLGMQIPFFLMQNIFKLNSTPYHLIIFLTQFVNIILVYYLIKLLSKNVFSGLFASFLYATSTTHYILYYWFATYAFLLAPAFFLSSFICFLKSAKNINWYILSIIFFILGLFTNELIITFGGILLLYALLCDRTKIKRTIPFLIISALFVFLRFKFFMPPAHGAYGISLGKEIIQNLKFYIFWSTNWSEMITEQLSKMFVFQAEFVREFSQITNITVYSFFIHWFVCILIIFGNFLIDKKNTVKLLSFGLLWYFIGLLPVILFSNHRFAYYLPISLVGIFLVIGKFFSKLFIYKKGKYTYYVLPFLIVLSINWVTIAYTTIRFNKVAHWAPRRAEISKEIIQKSISLYPYGIKGEYSFHIQPSSENKLALNDQDGLQVYFSNPYIHTVYTFSAESNP